MRALVLSGGGSKGSFQAGALKYLLGELHIHYDIICGVSVGALNGAFLSMFIKGEELKSSNLLLEMWNNIDTSKIYKRWFPFGRWHALWEKSFYDSSPLHNLTYQTLDLQKIRNSKKQVVVGAVSLNSGKYCIFDQNSDNFIEAVIASASFPGMLSPVKFLNQLWIDGGVKEISPVQQAINLGATSIDVITTSPQDRIKKFITNPTTVDVLKRAIDVSTDKIMSNDLEKLEVNNKLALANIKDKKYIRYNIIRPYFNLIEDLLDFNKSKIDEMIDIGYYCAKKLYITKEEL